MKTECYCSKFAVSRALVMFMGPGGPNSKRGVQALTDGYVALATDHCPGKVCRAIKRLHAGVVSFSLGASVIAALSV